MRIPKLLLPRPSKADLHGETDTEGEAPSAAVDSDAQLSANVRIVRTTEALALGRGVPTRDPRASLRRQSEVEFDIE